MAPSSEKTSKYIVCCMCGDTPAFSKDSFKLLFKGEPVPQIELQPNLYNFLPTLKRGGNFYNYVKDNLINTSGKYSYFFEVDADGKIIQQWDLLTGRKVL